MITIYRLSVCGSDSIECCKNKREEGYQISCECDEETRSNAATIGERGKITLYLISVRESDSIGCCNNRRERNDNHISSECVLD